jgi:membrane protease YdiL (CAAX protease family)
VFFAQSLIPQSALIPDLNKPNTFVLFLRTLSAGLTEEIAFRFGLMTFFVWALRSIVRKPSFEVPSLWVGNLLSAVLFASAHLNQFTYQGWDLLLPFMIVSSGTGMVMGWLYMRYGLVSAILAHFVADVTAHVLPRLVTGFG